MEILFDVTIIFAIAAVVLYLCYLLKIPTIVGLLISGTVAGPYGLGLVGTDVELLAEVGILFLLFTIGIEFSLKKLLRSKKLILVGGGLQVTITVLITYAIFMALGYSFTSSLFIGFLFAVSSTAIMLDMFQEKGQIDSPAANVALSVSIFQDMSLIPVMLLVPYMVADQPVDGSSLRPLLIGLFVVAAIITGSRYLLPPILHRVALTRNRELFLIVIVLICFATAFATYSIGLSLAMGAFLAGLLISESEYSMEAISNIFPLKKIFTSLFFVSVGMLLDVSFVYENLLMVLPVTIGLIVIKFIIILLVGLVLRITLRHIIIAGFALAQVGEFAFILSATGMEYEILSISQYQLFLAVSVISMAVTPYMINAAPSIGFYFASNPRMRALNQAYSSKKLSDPVGEMKTLKDHVVIIGYGINGRNVARAAKAARIPYEIIELNARTVREERAKGEKILFGDATSAEIIKKANLEQARVLVITVHDTVASELIIASTRKINPIVHIIVRTRFMNDMMRLYKLGAHEVVTEEFETSIELFSRVMRQYLVPVDRIENFVQEIRTENYEMLRSLSTTNGEKSFPVLPFFSMMEIVRIVLEKDGGVAGKTLQDLKLRNRYEVTLLAIERQEQLIHNPGGEMHLEQGDILYFYGMPDQLSRLNNDLNDVVE